MIVRFECVVRSVWSDCVFASPVSGVQHDEPHTDHTDCKLSFASHQHECLQPRLHW